jgi:hypothetical protein
MASRGGCDRHRHVAAASPHGQPMRGNSALTSHRSTAILRQAPGLTPTRRVNTWEKWLWSTKPQARAIVDSDASRFRSRALADSTIALIEEDCGPRNRDSRGACARSPPPACRRPVAVQCPACRLGRNRFGCLFDAARRHLEETDEHIEIIAEKCGYGGEEQMRAAFVRM